MKIIVDAYGGDNAPLEIIKGCVIAKDEIDADIVLVGLKELDDICRENGISLDGIEVVYAQSVISMNDQGTVVLKEKKDSTMGVGLTMLANGEGDAFLSAGNSGAICAGATLIVKRIKGIKRPGFATIIPGTDGYTMLMDSGANTECKPSYLYQFAQMGSIYMEKVMGIENPSVGLLNVGSEEHKGTQLQLDTYQLLKESSLNFKGNIEGRDVPNSAVDVAVCDGFTGNVLLKTYEGVAMALMSQIKGILTRNLKTKIAAGMILPELREFRKKFDYNEVGGAPILGCSKPVFKAHGSSKAKTIKNALKLVEKYVNGNVVDLIAKAVSEEKDGSTC